MIAFDTCLLVRFVTDDNQAQADLAESLMRNNTVFIPRTVLLESEWVLRSRYKKPREAILVPKLRLGMPSTTLCVVLLTDAQS